MGVKGWTGAWVLVVVKRGRRGTAKKRVGQYGVHSVWLPCLVFPRSME